VILIVLMMAIFVMTALPAFADSTGWRSPGDQANATGGDAPGWSISDGSTGWPGAPTGATGNGAPGWGDNAP
jgi:hypothetical protein